MRRKHLSATELVEEWMEEHGWTYRELAEETGYQSGASVWRVIKGERGASLDRVVALCELTGIDIEVLGSPSQVRAFQRLRKRKA